MKKIGLVVSTVAALMLISCANMPMGAGRSVGHCRAADPHCQGWRRATAVAHGADCGAGVWLARADRSGGGDGSRRADRCHGALAASRALCGVVVRLVGQRAHPGGESRAPGTGYGCRELRLADSLGIPHGGALQFPEDEQQLDMAALAQAIDHQQMLRADLQRRVATLLTES